MDFGFTDALNRTKLKVPIPDDPEPKSRLCNIFTQRVLRKLDLEEETAQAEGLASEKMESLIESVIELEPDELHEGTCPLCNQRKVLYHQVTNQNGEYGDVCQDCGMREIEKLRGNV